MSSECPNCSHLLPGCGMLSLLRSVLDTDAGSPKIVIMCQTVVVVIPFGCRVVCIVREEPSVVHSIRERRKKYC